MALLDALDGLVAEGDVEGLRLVRVRADERREAGGARVAFARGPRSRPCRR